MQNFDDIGYKWHVISNHGKFVQLLSNYCQGNVWVIKSNGFEEAKNLIVIEEVENFENSKFLGILAFCHNE